MIRRFLPAVALAVVAALPAAPPAQAQMEDARCWTAVRVTGPDAMRVSEHEAEQRLRLRCRAGDALVFLTDTGQPGGSAVARYCDMARPFLVERVDEVQPLDADPNAPRTTITMVTCTFRGGPRTDR
ncbi:hypothetical protein [Roseomonas fluvialis]|nr:hypothetical protein [Roseomonas fluvialis]